MNYYTDLKILIAPCLFNLQFPPNDERENGLQSTRDGLGKDEGNIVLAFVSLHY